MALVACEPTSAAEADGGLFENARCAAPPAVATSPPAIHGTLNINSKPSAQVFLDGKALGSTPMMGILALGGSHTLTFLHAEKGRKDVAVEVRAGELKTVAVTFD